MNPSFGTDLDSAYSLLSTSHEAPIDEPRPMNEALMGSTGPNKQVSPHPLIQKAASMDPTRPAPQSSIPYAASIQQTKPGSPNAPPTQGQVAYDANVFNQQYEREKHAAAMRYQQQQQQQYIQQRQRQHTNEGEPGYFDKLLTKKRDMIKIIIFALMILLAISLHSAIEYWLKDISTAYELSYKQELGVRVLYPVLIVVLLWNLKIWATR